MKIFHLVQYLKEIWKSSKGNMKRPLCIICLVFVVCMVWFGKQLKGPPFYLQKEQKNAKYYMGEIQKKEYKNDQISLYLSNVVFLNPIKNQEQSFLISDLSKQIKQYKKENSKLGCICYLDAKETSIPKIGAVVVVQGSAVDFQFATNLGMFDQKKYYQGIGMHFAVYQASICKQSVYYKERKEKLYQIRKKIAERLTSELGNKNGGILRAMLLGDKSELSMEMKEGYQRSGIAHVLAISGLHISILGLGLFGLLRRCKVPMCFAIFISYVFLIIYGVMVGGSASTVRAIVMFMIYMGAKIGKRPYDFLTSMVVAGSFIIGLKGGIIDPGFLLSFSAIMGLVFLPIGFYDLLSQKVQKKAGHLGKAFIAGCSIFIATLPIVTYFYFGVAPLSILANLFVIPLMTILMTSGIFLIITSVSVPFLSFFFRVPCEFILAIYEKIIYVSDKIPNYFLVTGQPKIWKICVYYGILFLWLMTRKRISRRIQFGMFLFMFGILLVQVQTNLQIEVLDVGQGDGIYIETGTGYSLFIDGGSTSVKEVGIYRIAPYLKAKGVSKIDYLFFTHYDTDHICGWIQLFEKMIESEGAADMLKVTTIVVSKETKDWEGGEELLFLARKLGIQICMIEEGDVMDFRGVTLTCIYPGKILTESANENSLVLLLNKEDFSMLLTGDLEGIGEERVTEKLEMLYNQKQRESIEVLKIGHHGSCNASSYSFLKEVDAQVGVISYGENNSYGHPAKETLNRLQAENMRYFGTGTNGAVLIESDGTSYQIETFVEQ